MSELDEIREQARKLRETGQYEKEIEVLRNFIQKNKPQSVDLKYELIRAFLSARRYTTGWGFFANDIQNSEFGLRYRIMTDYLWTKDQPRVLKGYLIYLHGCRNQPFKDRAEFEEDVYIAMIELDNHDFKSIKRIDKREDYQDYVTEGCSASDFYLALAFLLKGTDIWSGVNQFADIVYSIKIMYMRQIINELQMPLMEEEYKLVLAFLPATFSEFDDPLKLSSYLLRASKELVTCYSKSLRNMLSLSGDPEDPYLKPIGDSEGLDASMMETFTKKFLDGNYLRELDISIYEGVHFTGNSYTRTDLKALVDNAKDDAKGLLLTGLNHPSGAIRFLSLRGLLKFNSPENVDVFGALIEHLTDRWDIKCGILTLLSIMPIEHEISEKNKVEMKKYLKGLSHPVIHWIAITHPVFGKMIEEEYGYKGLYEFSILINKSKTPTISSSDIKRCKEISKVLGVKGLEIMESILGQNFFARYSDTDMFGNEVFNAHKIDDKRAISVTLISLCNYPWEKTRPIFNKYLSVDTNRTKFAIQALTCDGSNEAIGLLLSAYEKKHKKAYAQALVKSLSEIAKRRGLKGIDDLIEMNSNERADEPHVSGGRWGIGDYQVVLEPSNGKAVLSIMKGDKQISSIPEALRDNLEFSQIKTFQKLLDNELSTQKRRTERMMISEKEFTNNNFKVLLRNKSFADTISRLILEIKTVKGESRFAFFKDEKKFVSLDGYELTLDEIGSMRIAHPLNLYKNDKLKQGQDTVLRLGFVQPFKQVYRELYIITPAERGAVEQSSRFANNSVNTKKIYALFKAKGWTDKQGISRLDINDNLFAFFDWVSSNGRPDYWSTTNTQVTGPVYFTAKKDDQAERIPLANLPDVVFSEVMRDIDFFVALSTIDPENYRPGDSILAQRTTVQEVLSRLGLKDVELESHYAIVKGKKNTYKVNLYSGGIHLFNDNKHICIIPRVRPSKVMLPFESDDFKISEIISKILMLLDDDKIQDKSIIHQIEGR